MKDTEQDCKELSSRGDGCGDEGTVPRDAQEDKYLANADNSIQNCDVHSQLFVVFQETNAFAPLTSNHSQRGK